MKNKLTCIIVNYKTEKLTKAAVKSFVEFYPDVTLILIDNHSRDKSTIFVENFAKENEQVQCVVNSKNIGHGPALHQGIMIANTDYVFTLDSDTEILQGGFLQQMLLQYQKQERLYAVGWLRYVNCGGVSGKKRNTKLYPYVHPYASIIDRQFYQYLPKFENRGAPCTRNMIAAAKAGLSFYDFDLEPYIKHWVAGTRRMFKGKWNPKEDERKLAWIEDRSYPI